MKITSLFGCSLLSMSAIGCKSDPPVSAPINQPSPPALIRNQQTREFLTGRTGDPLKIRLYGQQHGFFDPNGNDLETARYQEMIAREMYRQGEGMKGVQHIFLEDETDEVAPNSPYYSGGLAVLIRRVFPEDFLSQPTPRGFYSDREWVTLPTRKGHETDLLGNLRRRMLNYPGGPHVYAVLRNAELSKQGLLDSRGVYLNASLTKPMGQRVASELAEWKRSKNPDLALLDEIVGRRREAALAQALWTFHGLHPDIDHVEIVFGLAHSSRIGDRLAGDFQKGSYQEGLQQRPIGHPPSLLEFDHVCWIDPQTTDPAWSSCCPPQPDCYRVNLEKMIHQP